MVVVLAVCQTGRGDPGSRYGLNTRPPAKAYLNMPPTDNGAIPKLLSQTGAFVDTQKLIPAPSLIPYEINVSFYSDGAAKARWFVLPSDGQAGATRIQFAPTGDWHFPNGTVFVKHFEMATDEAKPGVRRRLETRLLVRDARGGVYGATYKWRPDNSDAELLSSNFTETLQIRTSSGVRTQKWYYPSRQDCRTCHSANAGGVLGPKTRQINRAVPFPGGVADNQLRAWNHIGLFEPNLNEESLGGFARLAWSDDLTRSLEDRARSYLDVNCAYCHRPGGTVAYFDARYETPLERQGLVNGPVLFDEGLDKARVIAPHDVWRSVALLRISSLEGLKMPPLSHQTLDREGNALMRAWIESMAGPKVLAPPSFSVAGGKQQKPVELCLAAPEAGASIHYTLDGSAPTSSDPVYATPLKISESTTVRARVFKPGYTKSITVQETFIFARKP